MEKAMADLKSTTGYDGSGVWTEGPKTVVNYTDTQGKKRHQELNVYFVHADQDAKSPVVYEVLEDPKSGEMMFTIRASNHKDIKGLNEKQAALVRQAWAYLVAADPEVMQKFWRVNKVGGVGSLFYIDERFSTNQLIQGYGLILSKEGKNYSIEDISFMLLGESYELYTQLFIQDSNGYYINPPLDCLDLFYGIDAQKRVILWLEKYGNNLPKKLHNSILMAANGVIYNSVFTKMSRPSEPKIPFEP
jgi:hypothetical protein